ncbi:MAG: hypothetical protein E4H28_07775 [Gemmatimonadales bacterium]|nr:MAG: hypothetical protein E4H28_07775 [Gemmatimonadales bacterium]
MVARVGCRVGLFSCVVVSSFLVGCGTPEGSAAGGQKATEITRRPPQLVVFAYDRSTSISGNQLEIARQLTNERVRKLDHGDRIAAHQLLQLSLEEPPLRWSQDVPAREFQDQALSRDSISRTRFLQDAQDYLIACTDSLERGSINGTDILSTLHDIAADLRAARGRQSMLYIFSDMLQSTRTIEMEGLRAMPPDNWVLREKAAGTLPDHTGLCVVVVGARVDTNASQRVKRFWKEYFEATGARLDDVNYTLRPVTLPEYPCG